MSPALPTVGGSSDTWGTELNEFLEVGHNADGTNIGGTGGTSVAIFSRSGVLVVASGAGRFLLPDDCTITGVIAAINTAPIGASVICDVNKNGTTLFTTQAERPVIPAGEFSTTGAAVPDVTSCLAGDYLSVDIDQVGSSLAGADLTVEVLYTFV